MVSGEEGLQDPGPIAQDLSVLGLTDRELLQPCSQKVHVGALWAPLCPINCPPLKTFAAGVSGTAAQKGYTPSVHLAGPGLPLMSHPGRKCDAIDLEILMGHRGLPPNWTPDFVLTFSSALE